MGNFLLQSHAFRFEKCWGNILESYGNVIPWYDAQRNWSLYGLPDSQISGRWESYRESSKAFRRLRKFQLKLNPVKCTFGATSEKLLGFIVSRRGIEVDPKKIQAIQNLSPPHTQREVQGFFGRLNYISRFIFQMTVKCDPIFKLLKKHESGKWTEKCQIAFDKVKDYLSTPLLLVPPILGKPFILFLTIHEKSMDCVLGQHDETGKKEHDLYYLSKKFTEYESKYSLVEKMCCALAWTA